MRRTICTCASWSVLWMGFFVVLSGQPAGAQETKATAGNDAGATSPAASVPRLVAFSGVLKDPLGAPLTGMQGVTFALYKEQSSGAALWIETQNVAADAEGRFTVLLGAASPQGLPLDLFTSGQARWLGVQAAGQDEQPRILLASVPYALATAAAQPAAKSAVKALSADSPPQAGVSPQGDITAVIAANGLSGGGTEGDVTLQVRPCDSGQILKWTGGPTGSWTCQRDENSGGTITAVIPQAGSGLTGGGTLGAVTLGIDQTVIAKLGAANSFTSSISVVTSASVPPSASPNEVTKAADPDAAVSDDPPQSNLDFTQQNTAVLGSNNATSGVAIGVAGQSASPDGYGGAFRNTNASGKSLAALDNTGNDTFVVRSNGNASLANTGAAGYRLDVGGQINASAGLCINGNCINAPSALGDITAVNTAPGSGLMGAATSGDANLTLLTNCSNGQILKWTSGSWACADDIDTNSGGTVTSVTAGAGLTGGTINTTGTLAVNFAGSGAANAVARSDHNHDANYASLATVAALLDRIVVLEQQIACPGFPGGCALWSKRFGSSSTDIGSAIAVDSSGNVVVTGRFNGTVDFGGGPLTSAGLDDIFVAKFSNSGTLLWAKRFGGTGGDQGRAVAVDGNGDIVVTGSFGATSGGTVDFGGGVLTSAGVQDIFVAKLTGANGSHVWSNSFGTPAFDEGRGVAVDSSGNFVVVGSFGGVSGGNSGGTVNFGGANLISAGGEDIFVAKFSGSGVHQWSQRFGGTDQDLATAVAVDSSGNVAVTGSFIGTVDFGGGGLTSAGTLNNADIFVAKFSGTGTHLWSKGFGNIRSDRGFGVALDSSGNVVVTGHFRISVDFGGGALLSSGGVERPDEVFLTKLSAGDGSHLWSKGFGADNVDDRGLGVVVDGGENVVLTGFFGGTVDFGGGILTSAGLEDIFVAKFSGSSGAHLWSKRFGDTTSDQGLGIAVESGGNVVVTGFFTGTVDFGGGLRTSAGDRDIFLLKLLP